MTQDVEIEPQAPYRIDQMTIEDGGDIAMWRTPGPWAVQDALEAPRPDEGYWAVRDASDTLIGYCCFGEKARPLGLERDLAKLDVALGLAPQFTGRHLSREVGRTVLSYARQVANERSLRTAVATWNTVARHVTESVGFAKVGVHEVRGGLQVTTYYVYEM